MALAHNINLVEGNLTLCQKLSCGGAANRLEIKISSKKAVSAYFATYVDDNHRFKGRCTWGNGGFGFEVEIINSGGVPTVRLKAPNSPIELNFADDALEKFFNHLNNRLLNKVGKVKGGGKFKAPQVQAHKYKPYSLQTTQKRVDHWVEKGELDLEFGNFIKKHVDHGLRCIGE